jgi:hypothetical protein
MTRLTRAALLAAITLATVACARSHRASTSHPQGSVVSAKTASSSALIRGGRLLCTATVSRSVSVGSPLGLTFAVRNVSHRPVKVSLAFEAVWLVVKAADGTTYDTRVPLRNEILPAIVPTAIPPGTTKTTASLGQFLRVHWRGPLRITPGCGQTALPALRVAVTASGPPPDDRTAVAEVVAGSGHLLDRCRPEQPGVPVEGQIYSPDWSAPPMPATCSISLQREGQFLVAQVVVSNPPGLGVRVSQPYERLSVHHKSPFEASTWQFVVTKDGVVPVAAAEADATRGADRMAIDWSLSGSHWKEEGSSRCGGSGSGDGLYPMVEFISVCPA